MIIDNRKNAGMMEDRKKFLSEAAERIKSGTPLYELVEEDPVGSAMNYRQLEFLEQYLVEPRKEKPQVTWIFGATGTGKSTCVRDYCEAEGLRSYYHDCAAWKWFQFYNGQPVVVLEEFRGAHCPLNTLLRLFDGFPYHVEKKGGARQMRAAEIYITTPYSPHDIYRNEDGSKDEAIAQLCRRIDVVFETFVDLEGKYDMVEQTAKFTCGKHWKVKRASVLSVVA